MNLNFKYLLFLILIISTQLQVFATNYYLSNQGNDNNSGNSISKPWQTIHRLNKQKLKPGDKIFLKKGNVFFGEIKVSHSGNASHPIIFSCYGNGPLPVIHGALSFRKFPLKNKGIVSFSVTEKIKSVFDNNQLKTLARFPNMGFSIMQNGIGNNITFIDSNLTQKNGYWEGANIRFKAWDWEVRTSKVIKHENFTIQIDEPSSNKFEKGWGYYFDNKYELLDSVGEWFFDDIKNKLYYYAAANKNINIKAVVKNVGFKIDTNVHDVQIHNLKFQQFQDYGIQLSGKNFNINVKNCKIQNINNTGIVLNEECANIDISENEVHHINGRGIFALEPKNLVIKNNYVHHIGLVMGYGLSGVNGMMGIAIANNEVVKAENSTIARNNLISYNKIDSIGYVGIRLDGAYSTVSNNLVSNALLNLSDGSAIYTWALSKYYSHDNQFINNIVMNISGSNYGTPTGPNPISNGIYIDNRVYNCVASGNTISNITGAGIHVNSDSYDNLVSKNLVFNAKSSLSIAEWIKPATTYNNVFSNNTVFLNDSDSRGIILVNWLLPSIKELGKFDQNNYYSICTDSLMKEYYDQIVDDKKVRVEKSYTLDELRKTYGYEMNGNFINLQNFVKDNNLKPTLYYNSTLQPKKWVFGNKKVYNLKKELLSDVHLNSFESVIILE